MGAGLATIWGKLDVLWVDNMLTPRGSAPPTAQFHQEGQTARMSGDHIWYPESRGPRPGRGGSDHSGVGQAGPSGDYGQGDVWFPPAGHEGGTLPSRERGEGKNDGPSREPGTSRRGAGSGLPGKQRKRKKRSRLLSRKKAVVTVGPTAGGV